MATSKIAKNLASEVEQWEKESVTTYQNVMVSGKGSGSFTCKRVGKIGIICADIALTNASGIIAEGLPKITQAQQNFAVPYNQSGTTASSFLYNPNGSLAVYNPQNARYIFQIIVPLA